MKLSQIQSCKIYYGEDKKEIDIISQKGKKCLKRLSNYLKNKEDMLEESEEGLKISWPELDAYAAEKMPYCYIWVQFKGQQTISFAGDDGKENFKWSCDSILFDAEELRLCYSEGKEFRGSAFINYEKRREEDFSKVFDFMGKNI